MSEAELAVSMDGMLHFMGDCCQDRTHYTWYHRLPCGGAVEHFQGIYAGYITYCEVCDLGEFRLARRDDSIEGGHFIGANEVTDQDIKDAMEHLKGIAWHEREIEDLEAKIKLSRGQITKLRALVEQLKAKPDE